MDRTLRELVWRRAGNCCEYCRMPRQFDSSWAERELTREAVQRARHLLPRRVHRFLAATSALTEFV